MQMYKSGCILILRTDKWFFQFGLSRNMPVLFSERYGYQKVYRFFGFSFKAYPNKGVKKEE